MIINPTCGRAAANSLLVTIGNIFRKFMTIKVKSGVKSFVPEKIN